MTKTHSVPTTKSDSRPTPEQPAYRWFIYLAFAIVVAAPLVFSKITYDQFDLAKLAAVRLLTLGLLVIWLVRLAAPGDHKVRFAAGDSLLLGFLAAVFVSTFLSVSFNTSLIGRYNRYEGLMTFFNYALLYLLGMQIFHTATEVSRLSKAIVGTAYIVAAYGLMQFMRIDPLSSGNTLFFEAGKAFSTFGNPDLLGGYLALVAPMALAELAGSLTLLLEARSSAEGTGGLMLKVGLRAAGFMMIMGALLVTYTRGAWLAALIGLPLFGIFFARFLARHRQVSRGLLAAIAGGFSVAALALMAGLSAYAASAGDAELDIISRVRSIADFSEGSIATRLEIWKSGLAMIKDRPLFGFGPDTFRLMSERYETLAYVRMTGGTTTADNAHNYLIQIGAGAGLVALALLVGFLLYWLIFALRGAMTDGSREGARISRLSRYGLYCGVVSYLLYLLSGISVIGSSAVMWMVLGALMGTSARASEIESVGNLKPGTFRLILASALIVPAVLVSAYGLANVTGDYYFAKAIGYAVQRDSAAAVAAVDTGAALYPGNGHYYSEVGRYLLSNSPSGEAGFADRNIAVFEKARSAEPMEVAYLVFLGAAYSTRWQIYGDAADIRQSNLIARRALRTRPYSVPGRYLLGHNYVAQQRYDAAVRELKKVEGLSPGYQQTYTLLAEAYKGLGDTKQAAYYEKKTFAQQQSNTDK